MPNLTLYGKPYLNKNGKVIQPSMKFEAVHNFKYYTPYPYFASNLSEKPFPSTKDGSSESSANEQLVRASRVIEFVDSACFKPVEFTLKRFGNLLDRVGAAGSCEKISFFISSLGTAFILNETYSTDPNYFLKLGEQGLIARVVPINLSPYCGSWDPTPGAKPRTTSFLICDYKRLAELNGLEICLRNAIYKRSSYNFYTPPVLVPAWNCSKEVQHV
jgi:hypothetical protein